MGLRKSQARLTPGERARFVAAVLQLKANGVYDRYVRQHRDLFNAGIHTSVLFLPWHREFLRRFELDLQAIDPGVTLPYWDWTIDRSPPPALPWSEDFMGGNGEPPGGPVQSGPFAFQAGRWTLAVRDTPGASIALERAIGFGTSLPTANAVRAILARTPFLSFSPGLEISVHNVVHGAVGGSAATASSPNDPIFFLLHCNVDRLWAEWQTLHPDQLPFQGDGRFNLNSPMPPWADEPTPPTPAMVLNHTALGYTYDTDVAPPEIRDLVIGAPAAPASIGQPGEEDWYRFVTPTAGSYTLETEGPTDVVMSLFGPNSQTALVTEDDDSGLDRNARIAGNLSAGTYFVRIRHFSPGSTGNYGLSVRGAVPTPAIPEIQVNGAAVQGEIAAANESDLYTFTAGVTGLYTIETAGNTDTFLTLFGPNSQTSFITQDDDSGPELNSHIRRALGPGVYFIRVRHYHPAGAGSYSLSVSR